MNCSRVASLIAVALLLSGCVIVPIPKEGRAVTAGWKDFFDTYWKLVYGVAIKSGLNDAEAQDVVQETVLSVAKKMHQFKYDPAAGSFKNWLLLITRRRIADHLRKVYREPLKQGHDPRA